MFFLALGLALLTTVGALYLRLDTPKARAWERTQGIIDERFAFVFLPGFALALWGLATIAAANLSADLPVLRIVLYVVGVPLALAGALGVLTGLFGVFYPQWLVPQWRVNSPYRKPPQRTRRRNRRSAGKPAPK